MKNFICSLAVVVGLLLVVGSTPVCAQEPAPGSGAEVKATPATPPAEAKPAEPAKTEEKKEEKKEEKLDLNTASKEDLMKLPGIDDKIADAIIAGRPFAKKTELVDKKLVTEEVYKGLKDKVVAKGGKKHEKGGKGGKGGKKHDKKDKEEAKPVEEKK